MEIVMEELWMGPFFEGSNKAESRENKKSKQQKAWCKGWKKGQDSGINLGRTTGQLEIVERLLENCDNSIDEIAELTGVPLDQVMALELMMAERE